MKQLLLAGAACLLMLGAGCEQASHSEKEATFLATRPVEKDTTVFKTYVCQVRAYQHIELRALEKGYLQEIYVDEGRSIQQGQLMFRLNPLIYNAEVQKVAAEVRFVEVEYLNTKQLADQNIVSPSELALAKAKLDKAKADLALAQTHLQFTEIRAPFSGMMGRFQVRLGSLLSEGELLTTLSDNSKIWVYFNVPEAEYLDFVANEAQGKLPQVSLQMANGRLFEQKGTVETIEADFNNETGNIAFRATFDNPKRLLRHGETGNILMPVALKGALLIPQQASFEVLGKRYVFVIDPQGVVQMREIMTGAEMPHLLVVTKGLTAADNILVEGLRKVKNGDKVHYQLRSLDALLAQLTQLHAE
ncbi:efflux RND transporter periplasmic adaptor subunit [Eisenibacter elegans]|uniref:efflux RND transporter periplasmic adaptor subunit n=1 Tax=Eisenibacter elegans TaxID=997 RepID=UPI00041FE416|nr:efflux RND transporter periplasmic adaptor subunit [Eisenibacter elegans]